MTPRTVAHQAPLTKGFSRQEYWSGLSFPPPGDLSKPGTELVSPVSPALQEDSSPTEPSGKHRLWCVKAGSSVVTHVPLWWGILRTREYIHVQVQRVYWKTLCLPVNFAVNLKLLYKNCLFKKGSFDARIEKQANSTVLYFWKLLRVDLESFHHKKKKSLYAVMDVIKFTGVIILQYMHISSHYIVHLIYCMSIYTSIYLNKIYVCQYTSIKNFKEKKIF